MFRKIACIRYSLFMRGKQQWRKGKVLEATFITNRWNKQEIVWLHKYSCVSAALSDSIFTAPLLFPYLAMAFLLRRYWLLRRKPWVTRTCNRGLFSDCSLLPVARLRKWISLTGLGSLRERRTKHLPQGTEKTIREGEERFNKLY